MFRKKFAMGLALAGLLGSVLMGCASTTAAAPASQTAERPASGITVIGEGRAFAVPDIARISLGVESTGATAKAAMDENSRKMNAVVERIKALGIADRDIQTTRINVYPVYEQKSPEPRTTPQAPDQVQTTPRVIGYRAANEVRVTIGDPQRAPEVLDGVIGAGATNVSGLSFDIRDSASLRRQALSDAGREAQEKAKVVADSLGVTLGSVASAQEEYLVSPQPMPAAARATMAADSAPVEAGELTVMATVRVTYNIQ
ncbi:MAG: SIMPL domain-containing protein [Chloroflexota bacterium]